MLVQKKSLNTVLNEHLDNFIIASVLLIISDVSIVFCVVFKHVVLKKYQYFILHIIFCLKNISQFFPPSYWQKSIIRQALMSIIGVCLCVERKPVGMLFICVSPQAFVLHLPAASLPAECVPAGTDATREVEA